MTCIKQLTLIVPLLFVVGTAHAATVTTGFSTTGFDSLSNGVPNISNSDYADAASGNGVTLTKTAGNWQNASWGNTSVVLDGGGGDTTPTTSEAILFQNASDPAILLMDLQSTIDVGRIVTYSAHQSSRTEQRYAVYGSNTVNPPADNDPTATGWTSVAGIWTGSQNPRNGYLGVSITPDTGDSLGSYRYLLFDVDDPDTHANGDHTFYHEIDVFEAAGPPGPAVIADFNGSTTGLNPTAGNLDAGSPNGSWTINQRGRAAPPDGGNAETAIKAYADAAGDNYLELDKSPTSSAFDYDVNFDTAVPLDGSFLVSFDAVMHRVGPASTGAEKYGLIVGYDTSGDTLFQVVLDGNTESTTYLGVGLVGQPTSCETIAHIAYSDTAATTDMTTIAIALGASTFDLTVGANTAYAGIGYDEAVTDLSRLKFTALDPNAQVAGYSIDNVAVLAAETLIPEPATIAVWFLLGLCWAGVRVWRRRRKASPIELTGVPPARRPWTEQNRVAIRQMLDGQLAK